MRGVVFVAVAGLASQVDALQVAGMRASVSAPRTAAYMQTTAAKSTQVQSLLSENSALVSQLASMAPGMSEISLLRFAMQFPDPVEAKAALQEALAWRAGEGKAIVDSAAEAVAKATAGGGWDNQPVRDAAPNAALINQFVTPKNILSLSTSAGDLVYVIRASGVDDKDMMSKVSVDQVVQFFLFVKEVHLLVCNARSEQTGRLCNVIFANDITGTRKAPDPLFGKALTASSKSFEKLYPGLAGPTMILNLPFILQAFVALFKPLFPKTVQARLKFEKAPYLAKMTELTPLATDANSKKMFLAEIDNLLDDGFFATKGRI